MSKTIKLPKGVIKQSTYQKVVAENNRLKEDLQILCERRDLTPQKLIIIDKWRKYFDKEKAINTIIQEGLKAMIPEWNKEHPDNQIKIKK